jgi:hypothetical protein
MKRLYKIIDWNKVARDCIELPAPIEFLFQDPYASHTSGVFERVVGSLKKALRAILGRRALDIEEFRTALVICEQICNSRPLTYDHVGDDSDTPIPITPSHLVSGRGLLQIPDYLVQDNKVGPVALQWKHRQRLASLFWNRWESQYLVALQPFPKWLGKPRPQPRVGEVVLMHDKPKSRMFWPIGKVLELHAGRDDLIRSVTLKTANKESVRRDVRHLYRLEADEDRKW